MDELKKLDNLIKSVNKGGYFRCSICNTVSNESIATEIGDYHSHMSFTNDPKDPLHFICVTCDEVINDLRIDYEYLDDKED